MEVVYGAEERDGWMSVPGSRDLYTVKTDDSDISKI